MKTKLAASLLLGFFFAASSSMAAGKTHADSNDGLAQITITVYDYAHGKPRVLLEAERAAATLLRRSGVQVVWLNCPSDNASPSNPACAVSEDLAHLTLRILPDSMSKSLRQVHDDALGFAELGEPFNCNAWILYSRVKQFSLEQQLSFEPLLAGVIAHELGHLLLGQNSHADAGLMHGHWTRAELLGIEFARLTFSDSESKQIQNGVIVRHRAALSSLESSSRPD